MTFIYKVATINMNGIAQHTCLRMMEDFLWKHDIDVALLQEVTSSQIDTIRRYTKYINIGTEQRGTAIIVKDRLILTQARRLPSGRGIAGTFSGTCTVNICALSGAEKKDERETSYSNDLPYLLPTPRADLILAGDFNCVLSQSDTTGRENYSRAFENTVRGFNLTDVWDTDTRRMFTHYTAMGHPD
jgi:exonuclease III